MDNIFVLHNCAIERTADAGHKACGASFAPKAHRFPRLCRWRRSADRSSRALYGFENLLLVHRLNNCQFQYSENMSITNEIN